MEPALWAAKTGLDAQQTQMTVTANNLANVATNGFKRSRAVFDDLLYQNVTQVGAATSQNTYSPTGLQLGTGVRVVATERSYTQGNLDNTGNSLDLAIQGRGFFQVLQPDGTTAYTRAGSFQLSPTGEIVTADGFVVQPGITVPQNTLAVTINPSGQVLAQVAGQVAPQTVGQLDLANFANEGGLTALGSSLFQETPASGSPVTGAPGSVGFGTLNQGLLETSNVDVVSEITNLITAQRAYEMNSKVIQTSDQMMSTLNQIQ